MFTLVFAKFCVVGTFKICKVEFVRERHTLWKVAVILLLNAEVIDETPEDEVADGNVSVEESAMQEAGIITQYLSLSY